MFKKIIACMLLGGMLLMTGCSDDGSAISSDHVTIDDSQGVLVVNTIMI